MLVKEYFVQRSPIGSNTLFKLSAENIAQSCCTGQKWEQHIGKGTEKA
jgi:hypothetical protein